MEDIPPDIRDRVLGILRRYTFQSGFCECTPTISAIIDIQRVICMSMSGVMLECVISDDEGPMGKSFCGYSLDSRQCNHEQMKSFTLTVSVEQWDQVVCHHNRCAVMCAVVRGTTLDVRDLSSSIVPFRTNSDRSGNKVLTAELFAGGFSGWTQVIKRLIVDNFPIIHRWVLDKDIGAKEMYERSYDVTMSAHDMTSFAKSLQECDDNELDPYIFFHTSLERLWWCCFASKEVTDLLCMSPPCPAWSQANCGGGFARSDGLLMVHLLGILAIFRPRVLVLENVKGMSNHPHFGAIKALFLWAGFSLKWISVMNLEDCIPQHRERLIIVATSNTDGSLEPHVCSKWPVGYTPSLRTYDAIVALDEYWQSCAELSPEELQLYLDPKYLPKGSNINGNAKRTKFVVSYRLRSAEQKASCFLTTYGFPLSLDEDLLHRGGLYGSLIFDGEQIRKFTPVEVCILLGAVRPLWIPCNLREAFKLLGNAISVPHAAIGIANGLMFLIPMVFDCPVQDIFLHINSKHLNASNIQISRGDDGFLISFRDGSQGVSNTIPIRSFGKVTIESPLSIFDFRCEYDVPLRALIALLNGPSTPQSLNIQLGVNRDFQIPLTSEILMQSKNIRIRTSVPSLLALDESYFHDDIDSLGAAIIFTKDGIVCIRRFHAITCRGMLDALDMMDVEIPSDGCLTNLMGISHMHDSRPPTFSFLGSGHQEVNGHPFDIDQAVCCESGHCFHFLIKDNLLSSFLKACQNRRILRDLLSLGWHVVAPFDENGMSTGFSTLQKIPGRLAISHRDVREFLIARIFKALLQQRFPREYPDSVNVSVKLWHTWIWCGWIQKNDDLLGIVEAWNKANRVFGLQHDIRLVAGGTNINPEFPVAYFYREISVQTGILPIHIIGTLQGGGPSTHSVSSSISHDIPDELVSLASSSHTELQDQVDRALHRVMQIREEHQLQVGDPLSIDCIADLSLRVFEGMFFTECSMIRLLEILHLFRWAAIDQTLDEHGWLVLLQFRSYADPIRARIVITPKPSNRQRDMSFVRALVMSALFFGTIPQPMASTDESVTVSLKLFGVVLCRERIPYHWQLKSLMTSWNTIAYFTEWVSQPRFICRGKGTNPDFYIGDYATKNDFGELKVKFHVVFSLHGGGPPKGRQDDMISVKNRLAAFLLEQGCDIQAVSVFSDKCINAAGHVTVSQIMKIDHHDKKLEALGQLARTLAIPFPDVNKAASKRIQQVKNKLVDAKVKPVSIDVDSISLKADYLVNEDGTNCPQLKSIRAGACGVAFVQSDQASEWIRSDRKISPDELGVLVVGQCPKGHGECRPVQLPAFDAAGCPLVLSACLHQLGEKQVHISDKQTVSLKIDETQVIALTLYKNEVDGVTWTDVIQSPCKICLQILEQSGLQVSLPSPPWGRSWHGLNGKVQPPDADSFQCHIRVSKKDIGGVLKASGFHGLYTTPKNDQHSIDKDFCVIWDDRSLLEMQVVASSTARCLGLVKSLKNGGKKINRGFRCHRDHMTEVHQVIKPGADVPDVIRIEHVAKIAPTPMGASFDDVKEFLAKMKWAAKPLKALGSTSWLIGSPQRFSENFGSWNGQVLLVQWLPPKAERPQKIILAGKHVVTSQDTRTGSMQNGGSLLHTDPWANWNPSRNSSGLGNTGSVAPKPFTAQSQVSNTVMRSVDGPNETRFKDNEAKIEELKNQLSAISQKVDLQGSDHKQFQDRMQKDFESFKSETFGNFQNIQDAFDVSLQKSLAKQDQAMQSNFSELKNLIMGRPNPAKKAKSSPNQPNNDNDEDEDM